MLLPNSRPIAPIAAKRLKAIEEYSHLGAGFRIALRDLEIRGAGNILGPEQSGHIQMVGYQMYCDMLAQAVREMKNEKVEPLPTANIDLGFSAVIPKNYVPIDRHRMDVYRKIAVARTPGDLQQIEAELADVYGPIPDETKGLLDLAELRIAAAKWDIRSIVASQPNPLKAGDLIFSFRQSVEGATPSKRGQSRCPSGRATVGALFASVKGTVRIADPKTVYLRLPPSYFEPQTLVTVLAKILAENQA